MFSIKTTNAFTKADFTCLTQKHCLWLVSQTKRNVANACHNVGE